ncbi:MAG TPA: hypothetical protein VNE83_00835 [Terriglobales bacterium]|nr:hypothetical protein [Terriglobales bacterium]
MSPDYKAEAGGALVRDHAVDLIKGWACLLMVIAHVPIAGAAWLRFDTMGAVLFFFSTGMNLWGLAARQRGDDLRIAANGLFLIFAGFANNYVQGTLWMSDVFQSAGMAMIAMLILNRLLPRWWTWLFPLPYAIHFANQHYFYWKIADGGVSSFFLAPGLFPLLPWLTFYLLGAHLKRYSSPRMRIAIGGAALAGFALTAWGDGLAFNKFWMSPDYWLLGLAYGALLLDGLRRWLALTGAAPSAASPRIPLAELRFWGANSLVFYILQGFVIRLFQIWWPAGVLLLALAFAGTALLLRGGLWLQHWARAQPPVTVLAVCALFSATILGLEASVLTGYLARTFISFGLTFAFLAAYPAFKLLSDRLPRIPPAQKPFPVG